MDKVFEDFQSANWLWILVIILIYILSNIFRSIRWHQLLKPIGCTPKWYNSFFTIMLGYFANLGLPRVGEFVRAGTFAKYENQAPEKVMGTIVVDRIFDFICLFVMIA
ncbi:MAG: lysylphosphatidylglycerol synthase transmembrane domain-containing protein, partial [Bacteroidota bacterium]